MARGGRDATGDRGGEHGRVPSRGGSFQELFLHVTTTRRDASNTSGSFTTSHAVLLLEPQGKIRCSRGVPAFPPQKVCNPYFPPNGLTDMLCSPRCSRSECIQPPRCDMMRWHVMGLNRTHRVTDPEYDAYKRGAFLEKTNRFTKDNPSDVPGESYGQRVR